jgi:hypothetical protein
MAEVKEQPKAADPKRAQVDALTAESERAGKWQEQQADLNVMAFNIEASRRTGLTLAEATKLVERLQTEGDFFDDKGRWTLDVAGYPVLHKGWKPEKIELP